MPEFLARLTRAAIPLKREFEALPTEATGDRKAVLAEQLGPTRPASLGWPNLRWAAHTPEAAGR